MTEYERGRRDGVQSRENMAHDVMSYTAKIELENIRLQSKLEFLQAMFGVTIVIALALIISVGVFAGLFYR